jgi:hypothetical protein
MSDHNSTTTTDATTTTTDTAPAARVVIDWNASYHAVLIGPIWFSVTAGPGRYSTPRTFLPRLSDYEEVEMAMWLDARAEQVWVKPSDLVGYNGPGDEEAHFSPHDDVAAYVPLRVAQRLEAALHEWAANGGTVNPRVPSAPEDQDDNG